MNTLFKTTRHAVPYLQGLIQTGTIDDPFPKKVLRANNNSLAKQVSLTEGYTSKEAAPFNFLREIDQELLR